MAFEPILWKDRQIERPNTFTLKNNPDGTYTLIPVPGTIFEQGTALSAQTLNLMQNKIKEEFNAVNMHFADIETEFDQAVGNLTVDSEVILARNSSVKGTTFPVIDNRFESLEGDTYLAMTNLVTNGDFSNGTTGWSSIDAVNNGVAEKTNTSQYQSMSFTIANPTALRGHKVYAKALIKSDSTLVSMTISDGIALSSKHGSGINQFENLSVIHTTNVTANNVFCRIQDSRASGWTTYYADNVVMIDLTAIFGNGNEPSVSEMDAILALYPNSWFTGTENIGKNSRLLKFLLNLQTNKVTSVQEKWITPTLLNGWEAFDLNTYSTVKYFKDQFGFVHFHGLLKNGTVNQSAFTLPVGYRPANGDIAYFSTRTNSRIILDPFVNSAGSFVPTTTAYTGYIVLTGLSFKAEA